MKISRFLNFIKYYWQFNPFRLNFFLFVAMVWMAKRYLLIPNLDTSSFSGIILLMTKIALVFSFLVVTVSFLSACFCFLYFLYQKGKKGNQIISLQMDLEAYRNNVLKIITKLPFAFKPLLGFVKVRLLYDKHHLTERYILADRIKKQFFAINSGIQGNNTLSLPDIKEYYFSDVLISFEDMLQFFSFTINVPLQNTVCNLPHSLLESTHELPPKKTEEEKVRIEQLRKVEGEYLHYKKFEDADDVRRIVWKIFAKNKELVVRIPEIMDPFASHIYMYASFFSELNISLGIEYQQEMINHYKNCVWTIYEALTKKEFEVKYIADQSISNTNPELNSVQYTLALSSWQQETNLVDYFKPKHGNVLCIHSLTSKDDLARILSSCDPSTNIFFIQFSKIFRSHYLMNWLIRIFIKPNPDRLTNLKSKWTFHPMKFQMMNDEKALLSLLHKSDINLEII